MLVTASRVISMGHRLPSYPGICSSMHGHNVRVEVSIRVKEFLDFKEVDTWLKAILDPLDHAMVMYEHDPFVPQLKKWPQRLVLLNVEPTTENIAQLIMNEIAIPCREAHSTIEQVVVHETDKYRAVCTSISHTVERVTR